MLCSKFWLNWVPNASDPAQPDPQGQKIHYFNGILGFIACQGYNDHPFTTGDHYPKMNWLDTLLWLGVLQGLIIAGILVAVRSDHRAANGIMATMVLLIALFILQRLLLRGEFFFQHPATAVLIPPLDFALGPLLYLYAYKLTGGVLRMHQWAHFLPVPLLLCLLGSLCTLSPEVQSQIVTYFWSPRNDPALRQAVGTAVGPILWVWIEYYLHGSLFALQFGLYCLLVLRRIRDHNRHLQQHYSSPERINLRWLRALTLALLVFLLLFVLFNRLYLMLHGQFDSPASGLRIPLVYLAVFIYAIGISAIFQPSLLSGTTQGQAAALEPALETADTPADLIDGAQSDPSPPSVESGQQGMKNEPRKYAHSSLSVNEMERYKMMLTQTMENEQLYLDSELTLQDLARHTGLSANLVSQVINEQMNLNFFQLR